MEPADIPQCVDVLAKHAVIGPRYGPAIEHLASAWHRVLGCDACFATVFHAGEDERAPICLFGFGVAVHDDFVVEMKKLPPFWAGPEITRRVINGEAPVLTDKQVREANSSDGMNLLIWEGCARAGYEAHGELPRYMMAAMIEVHQGYLWKEIIATHPESPDRLRHTLSTGGCLWDPIAGCYTDVVCKDAEEIVGTPHVIGVTRDLERSRRGNWSGSWVGALFDYHAPLLGFTRSEQRLLSAALSGATDEQLAGMLGVSTPTVKKMWVSVYNRVEESLSPSMPDLCRTDISAGGRGKEKRRGLLAYLRKHSEELRPYSRKLASRAAEAKASASEA